jgi:hypothetical protein
MTDEAAAELPLSVYLRPQLHPDALAGLPGEIAVRVADATGADPAAALMCTLAFLGNAAGPQPHIVFGGGVEHPARFFVVVVGDPAQGRKGTAVSAVLRLFTAADQAWAGRITGGLKSPEALIAKVDDDLSDDGRLMIIEAEFARLAEQMARTGFSPVLRAAWDGEVLANDVKDSARCRRASHAHVSMVAMITPAELLHHHRRLSQAGGLESRMLFCMSAPSSDVNPFEAASADMSDLTERLRKTLEASRNGILMHVDPISRVLLLERGVQPSVTLPLADELIRDWRSLVRARLPRTDAEDIGSLWARAEVQVVRLACAYAVSDCAPAVGLDHVNSALAAWRYCAESAEILFGIPVGQESSPVDPAKAAKVIRHLYRSKGWVSRTAISKDVLKGNTSAADIDLIMAHLAGKGHVEYREITDTGGGPLHQYRLAPPKGT